MVLLMVLTGELVMKWIGEIEGLLLLVLQFLGIVLMAICAIVFGKIGLREIQAEPETQGGKKGSDRSRSWRLCRQSGTAWHRRYYQCAGIVQLWPVVPNVINDWRPLIPCFQSAPLTRAPHPGPCTGIK